MEINYERYEEALKYVGKRMNEYMSPCEKATEYTKHYNEGYMHGMNNCISLALTLLKDLEVSHETE